MGVGWVLSGKTCPQMARWIRQRTSLTHAPLGYSAERAPLGGIFCPLPNSRTNRRSEAGEAMIENPEREDSNAQQQFSLRSHM